MMKRVVVGVWCAAIVVALSCGQAGATVLDDLNAELARIVKAAAPSVVEISGGRAVTAMSLDDMAKFLKDKGGQILGSQVVATPSQSVGSGFVIDADGYILTTSDVARSDKVTVKFSDGTQCEGKVVGKDDLADVAVIKVDRTGLKPLPLGDSNDLQVGNLVVSVNNQAGLQSTVSLGVVAGLDRELDEARGLIQISGTIGPGASGGPVLDSRGRVVGVTFAMLSPSPSALPFNIPKIIIGSTQTPDDILRALGGEEGARMLAELDVTRKLGDLEKARANVEYRRKQVGTRASGHPDYPRLKAEEADAEADLNTRQAELDVAKRALELVSSPGRPSPGFCDGSATALEATGAPEYTALAEQMVQLKERELQNAETKKKYWADEVALAEKRANTGLAPMSEARELKLKALDADTDVAKGRAELQAAKTQLELLKRAGPMYRDFLDAAKPLTRTSGSSGFAIPIDRIKPILDDLKAGKEVERGFLGAEIAEKDGKILFKDTEKDSPADEAGLKAGDVLVSADGRRFDEVDAFKTYISGRKPGDVVKIIVERDGKECEVSANLGKLPTEKTIGRDARALLKAPFVAKGGTFSLSVEDAGIAEIAKKLSDASGVSVIVTEPEKIKKRVTVHLKSTTVEKALDVICRTLGCDYKKDGDTYVISPK